MVVSMTKILYSRQNIRLLVSKLFVQRGLSKANFSHDLATRAPLVCAWMLNEGSSHSQKKPEWLFFLSLFQFIRQHLAVGQTSMTVTGHLLRRNCSFFPQRRISCVFWPLEIELVAHIIEVNLLWNVLKGGYFGWIVVYKDPYIKHCVLKEKFLKSPVVHYQNMER